MSDLILLGVLRAPTPEPDNILGIHQLADRARQAADEIERLREALQKGYDLPIGYDCFECSRKDEVLIKALKQEDGDE